MKNKIIVLLSLVLVSFMAHADDVHVNILENADEIYNSGRVLKDAIKMSGGEYTVSLVNDRLSCFKYIKPKQTFREGVVSGITGEVYKQLQHKTFCQARVSVDFEE